MKGLYWSISHARFNLCMHNKEYKKERHPDCIIFECWSRSPTLSDRDPMCGVVSRHTILIRFSTKSVVSETQRVENRLFAIQDQWPVLVKLDATACDIKPPMLLSCLRQVDGLSSYVCLHLKTLFPVIILLVSQSHQ